MLALVLKAIYQAGGCTIAQDAATCAVYPMPQTCAQLGILKRTAPIGRVASEILSATQASRAVALSAH